jgi:uncharacterized protein YozE (UPF0346 family)
LSIDVEAEILEAMHKKSQSFHSWLADQRHRNDGVGDLARDVHRDQAFPTHASTREDVEAYLSRHGFHIIRAFRQAWREFSAQRPTG